MYDPHIEELFSKLLSIAKEQYDKANSDLDRQIVLDKLKDIDMVSILNQWIDDVAGQTLDETVSTRFEHILRYRAEDNKFLASLDSKWNRGFVASELLYIKGLACIEEFKNNINELPDDEKNKISQTYTAMIYLFSRASQQYLEILTLIKGGLADGALARWRSLYELSIVASFIIKHGETVAKAFIDAAYSTDKYNWAKSSGIWQKNKSIAFKDIRKHCDIDTSIWDEEYKQATIVSHPSAQATFQRIGSKDTSRIVPVGRSDFGVPYPAIIASKTYIQIITMFLNLYPTTSHVAMMKVFNELISFIEEEYKWCVDHIEWSLEDPIINGDES